MRCPDDTGLKAQRGRLQFCRFCKLGGDDKTTRNPQLVEISDVMQTARRAGPSVGQGNHDDIGISCD